MTSKIFHRFIRGGLVAFLLIEQNGLSFAAEGQFFQTPSILESSLQSQALAERALPFLANLFHQKKMYPTLYRQLALAGGPSLPHVFLAKNVSPAASSDAPSLSRVRLFVRQADDTVMLETFAVTRGEVAHNLNGIASKVGALIQDQMPLGVKAIALEFTDPDLRSNSAVLLGAVKSYIAHYSGNLAIFANFDDPVTWSVGSLPNAITPEQRPIHPLSGKERWNQVKDWVLVRLGLPVPHRDVSFGIDVGGTYLKVVVLSNGRLVSFRKIAYADLPAEANGDLGRAIELLLDKEGHPFGLVSEDILSKRLEVSIAGTIRPTDGRIVEMINIDNSRPGTMEQLQRFAEKHPEVALGNDANVATAYHLKARRLHGTTLMFAIGTGLGFGIIHEGKLLLSPMQAHIRTKNPENTFNGEHGCGPGCAENYANGAFVVRRAKELIAERQIPLDASKLSRLEGADVGSWLDLTDDPLNAVAEQVFSEMGGTLFDVAAPVARYLNVDSLNIVLAGGVAGGLSGQAIRRGIERRRDMLGSAVQLTIYTSEENQPLRPGEKRAYHRLPAQLHGAAGAALGSDSHVSGIMMPSVIAIRLADGRVIRRKWDLSRRWVDAFLAEASDTLAQWVHGYLPFGIQAISVEIKHKQNPSQEVLMGVKRYLDVYARNQEDLANFGRHIEFKATTLSRNWWIEGRILIERLWQCIFRNRAVIPHKGISFGVDVGGGSLKFLVLENGRTSSRVTPKSIPYDDLFKGRPDRHLGHAIEAFVREQAGTFGITLEELLRKRLTIGIAGTIHPDGHIVEVFNLEKEFPEALRQLEDLRSAHPTIRFVNDGSLGANYHARSKNLRGATISYTLGTGLGLGIAVNGKLLTAPMEGHVRTNFSRNVLQDDGCGPGCSEAQVNKTFVVLRAKQLLNEQKIKGIPKTAEDVGHWLSKPVDDPYRKIAEQVFYEVGRTLMDFTVIIADRLPTTKVNVVIAGGVATGMSGERIAEGIRQARSTWYPYLTINVLAHQGSGTLQAGETRDVNDLPEQFIVAAGAALASQSFSSPKEGSSEPQRLDRNPSSRRHRFSSGNTPIEMRRIGSAV